MFERYTQITAPCQIIYCISHRRRGKQNLHEAVLWLRRIAHFPAIFEQGPLICVVRILKDRDHSTLSTNLLNF